MRRKKILLPFIIFLISTISAFAMTWYLYDLSGTLKGTYSIPVKPGTGEWVWCGEEPPTAEEIAAETEKFQPVSSEPAGMIFTFDGGGSPISDKTIYSLIRQDCTITGYYVISDEVGDATIVVSKTTYSNYPSDFTAIDTIVLNNEQKHSGLFSAKVKRSDVLRVAVTVPTLNWITYLHLLLTVSQ